MRSLKIGQHNCLSCWVSPMNVDRLANICPVTFYSTAGSSTVPNYLDIHICISSCSFQKCKNMIYILRGITAVEPCITVNVQLEKRNAPLQCRFTTQHFCRCLRHTDTRNCAVLQACISPLSCTAHLKHCRPSFSVGGTSLRAFVLFAWLRVLFRGAAIAKDHGSQHMCQRYCSG